MERLFFTLNRKAFYRHINPGIPTAVHFFCGSLVRRVGHGGIFGKVATFGGRKVFADDSVKPVPASRAELFPKAIPSFGELRTQASDDFRGGIPDCCEFAVRLEVSRRRVAFRVG